MKKVIYILAFSIPLFLQAQNYQNICSPGITFYKDVPGNFKAFRLDSIHLPGNNDTIFYSFAALRDTNATCRDTTNGSIFGRKILKKHNGWVFFFNKSDDSIRVNTQASLNASWKIFDLLNNEYLLATVTSVQTDSLLGITDQVKVITLQAKNSSNQNISHAFNGKTVLLSQHYGFSKLYDAYNFPIDTAGFWISGKSYNSLGMTNLTPEEVFDFNPGDVLHYQDSTFDYISFHFSATTRIYKILSGKKSGEDDITYQVERCYVSKAWGFFPYYYSGHDTINVSYNPGELSGIFSRLPDEFLPFPDFGYRVCSFYGFQLSEMHGREQKTIDSAYYYYTYLSGWNDFCWRWNNSVSRVQNIYTKGLGNTFYKRIYVAGGPYGTVQQTQLVYYEKGSEIWGTPVSADCSTLVSLDPTVIDKPLRVIISPNPVTQTATITIEGYKGNTELKFQIFDNLGRIVFSLKTNDSTFTFDPKALPDGLYIYQVTGKELNLTGKLILE